MYSKIVLVPLYFQDYIETLTKVNRMSAATLIGCQKSTKFMHAHALRHAINIKKVKVLLTLYGPLPTYFLLSKAEASCSCPPPPQSQQKLHSEQSFNLDSTPYGS